MAGIPSVLSAAINAVKQGMSGNAAYRAFQATGGAVRRATFQRTIAEVRRTLADSLDEATRPLNRRPNAAETTVISTKTRSGYMQQVDVYVRDKDTGEVESRPFSWRTQVLVTRAAAVNEALNAFNDGITGSPDRFNEEVLGATYTGTLQLIPRGSE